MPDDKTARVFRALNAGPLANTAARDASAGPVSIAHDDAGITWRSHGNAFGSCSIDVAPVIADVKARDRLIARMSATPRVSGAGPTCFGLFDSLAHAAQPRIASPLRIPSGGSKPTRLGITKHPVTGVTGCQFACDEPNWFRRRPQCVRPMQNAMTCCSASFSRLCRENRQCIVRNAAIRPRPLKRRFNGFVALHQRDGVFKIAILNVAVGNGAVPELTLVARCRAGTTKSAAA